jgi:hypothetical protein
MKPPLPHGESAVPRTLHAQLEIAKAMRMLMAPDEDELLRRRRAEIAAIRGELEAIKRDFQKVGEECLALAKAELRATLAKKYNPDQPRVPKGNHGGGQWTSGNKAGTDALDVQNDLRNLYHALFTVGRSRLGYAAHFFGSHYFDIKTTKSDQVPVDHPRAPVPFVDSDNEQIFDAQGNPLLRPVGLAPELYAQAGNSVRSWAETFIGLKQEGMLDDPDVANVQSMALATIASKILLPLAPGGPLDAERFDWTYVLDYRHYQNIMIGVYGAAAGMSRDQVLSLVDLYATIVSEFRAKDKEPRDEFYTHSAKQDAKDTNLGYELYESGRIRLKP